MPHPRTLAVAAALMLAAGAVAIPVAAQDESPVAPAASAAPAISEAPASSEAPVAPTAPLGPPSATPNPVAMEVPSGDGTAVRLTTEEGDIVIGLFNESAPVAAENFLNLATSGFYDGVGFHRAVPGFVLQGGDPEGTGQGGPGYTIADEEVVGEYGRGIVAMARTPQPNSQGSQFFFVLDDSAKGALDSARTYAIFGRVVEGMDVVDRIVEARPPSDLIEDPVKILSASVEQVELPPEPTAAPPSAAEVAASDLAALVPDEILGFPIEKVVFTADEIAQQVPDALSDFETVAADNDADAGLLSVVQAGGGSGDDFVSIAGGTVPGVPGDQLVSAMTTLMLGVGDDAILGEDVIGGRDVTRIGLSPEAGPGEVAYRFVSGENVWFIVTTDEDVEPAIAALP